MEPVARFGGPMTAPDKKTFDAVMAMVNAVKVLDSGENLHHGTVEHEAVAVGVLMLADVVGDPNLGFSLTSDNDLDGYQAACEASVWLGDGNALEPQSMHHRALSWGALKLVGRYIHEPLQGAPEKGSHSSQPMRVVTVVNENTSDPFGPVHEAITPSRYGIWRFREQDWVRRPEALRGFATLQEAEDWAVAQGIDLQASSRPGTRGWRRSTGPGTSRTRQTSRHRRTTPQALRNADSDVIDETSAESRIPRMPRQRCHSYVGRTTDQPGDRASVTRSTLAHAVHHP